MRKSDCVESNLKGVASSWCGKRFAFDEHYIGNVLVAIDMLAQGKPVCPECVKYIKLALDGKTVIHP
jgi:hypothetical protein